LIHAILQQADLVNEAGGELFHDLKAGHKLRIIDGPFTGYEAIFDVRQPEVCGFVFF